MIFGLNIYTCKNEKQAAQKAEKANKLNINQRQEAAHMRNTLNMQYKDIHQYFISHNIQVAYSSLVKIVKREIKKLE